MHLPDQRAFCGLIAGAALLAIAAAASHAADAPAPPDPIEILSDGILSRSEIRGLLAEETEVVRMKEVSERELAVVLACLTPESPESGIERFRNEAPLSAGAAAELVLRIPSLKTAPSLETFTLGPKRDREALRYLNAQPGYDLNLDRSEIERFRALGEPPKEERGEVVDKTLREILTARLTGFGRAGLRGTSPYLRKDGVEVRPAFELEQSYRALRVDPPLFPRLHAAWNDYPQGLPEDAEEQFFVSRAEIVSRPNLILTHRMWGAHADRAILVERDFYASHFFDSALNVAMIVPLEQTERNLFLFVHRVWVDRWNGFARLKRRAGHKAIVNRLRKNLTLRDICHDG